MPLKVLNIFKGEFKRNFDSRDFLESEKDNDLLLKHLILLSGRLAFHYTFEAFVMGEMEMTDAKIFESEVLQLDKEWFLGSEVHLWNQAISKTLPNLERLIQKKDDGQYFAHRLKFG